MHAPSFVNEPQVQFLSSLLEEIKRGFLQVPRFQRPFVWRREQQIELLRSIRDGIPIGALLVWRTHNSSLACYDRLGPYRLASPPRGEGAVHQYLLDGHQRLSTLYAALHRPEDEAQEPGNAPPFRAYVDLETRDFHILEEGDESEELNPRYMPLHALLDSIRMVRIQRRLPEAQADRWIETSDEISRAFREYKIAVIPVVSEDLELATATFKRINSQGTEMGRVHMVHALTWSASFDLLQRIADLKEEHLRPLGWQDLDDEQVLDVCKTALRLDLRETTAERLSRELRPKPEVLKDAVLGITGAAHFLRERCSIHAPGLVPHAVQITLLAETFRSHPSPTIPVLDLLHAWFWLSTYTELFFGSGSDRRIRQALEDLRIMAHDARPRWPRERQLEKRSLPPTLDLRSSRAKTLAVRLAEQFPSPPSGREEASAAHLLALEGHNRLLSQLLLRHWVSPSAYGSPGNRFLVQPENVRPLLDALQNRQSTLQAADLQKLRRIHVVSDEALRLLRAGNLNGFIHQRRHDLDALEDAFFAPLAARFQPALRGS
ncbi:DUF262 domain-containing protein [Chondromyces apiculatus]|uniref:GmrSD restriction endonucleases N-terminal domain-containing protein n=1 Tax=Chondromyces apiculatus DSM 436 TaxID=1192034 RepID=A0A017SVQ5_9BACT|nr:DUF262 domain-containing protein [Chondromyces apiculatus]EYF00396.1 Hypothetical protein CAP_0880 [Chondromyces apiculatus DSM 436]